MESSANVAHRRVLDLVLLDAEYFGLAEASWREPVCSRMLRNISHDLPVYVNHSVVGGGTLPFSGTPATFLISPDGRIAKAWHGAYDGKVKAEIEMTLNVRLPGLSSDRFTDR